MKNLYEQYEFRNIKIEEIPQAAEIEKRCFPPNEACSYENMEQRIRKAPDLFLVAVDREKGLLAGFLNGLATDEEHLTDDFLQMQRFIILKERILCSLGLMFFWNTGGMGLREN